MMSSAVAFQMKGLGSVFQWSAQVVMALVRSATLVKVPRRRRLSVSSLNQRSIRFSHELEVGVKCRCQRRRSRCASHFVDLRGRSARRGCRARRGRPDPRDGGVDLLEEPQHVGRGVTFVQSGEDLAGGDVHRGEQVDGAVALVVVGHRAGSARLHRQRGLGAVQRLALGLLVEAEHHRPRRRVEVQPDDVDELLLEQRIVADLERLDLPRLEVVVGPDLGDRVLADPDPWRPSTGWSSASSRRPGRSLWVSRSTSSTVPGRQRRLAAAPFGDHTDPGRARRARTGPASAAPCPRPPRTGARSPRWPSRRRPTAAPGPEPPCDAATTSSAPSPQLGPLLSTHRQRRRRHHWHTSNYRTISQTDH